MCSSRKRRIAFTDYGVSGIAVMQLSAYMEPDTQYKLSIDFFDELDEKQLREYIELRQRKGYNHFYDGLLNHKLSVYFEKKNVHDVQKMIMLLKRFELEITGLRSYETAQVMKGGLSLEEVNDLLEIKNIHICMQWEKFSMLMDYVEDIICILHFQVHIVFFKL